MHSSKSQSSGFHPQHLRNEVVANKSTQEEVMGALEFKVILSYRASWRLMWDLRGPNTHARTHSLDERMA